MNISHELRQFFQLAALRKEARSLRTASDWEKANEITSRYQKEQEKLTKQYFSEYDTRVEKVIQGLIDKAGSKEKNFVHRIFGTDHFDKSATIRQAHRIVQDDHQRRLSALAGRESSELEALTQQAAQRDQLRGEVSAEFRRSASLTRQISR